MARIAALILAGGRVDELGVLTQLRPKCTVPFGGLYRIIDFPLSNLMQAGIGRVGILSQFRPSSLIEHIGGGESWDMVGRRRGITLLPPFQAAHAADWYKGTADAVYQNRDFIQAISPELVLICSGDHVYHMDYTEMVEFHLEKGADVTCAFVQVPEAGASRFGLARIGGSDPRGGPLEEYREKPEEPFSRWASMTVYLFETDLLFRSLEENASSPSHEFGRDIIPWLMGRARVYGYKFHGYWAYARTIDEYYRANMDLLGQPPLIEPEGWGVRTNLRHESIEERGPAYISPEAVVENSMISSGAVVEGRVEDSILFPGVHVEPGAVVKESILFYDCQIGREARVERTICDIAVTVGKGCRVGGPGAITTIGSQAQIPMGGQVAAGAEVAPSRRASRF